MKNRISQNQTITHNKIDQSGYILLDIFIFIIACVILLAIVKIYNTVVANQGAAIAEIKSGVPGYCMDLHRDILKNGSEVDNWKCNGTAAQVWVASNNKIQHKNLCLSVENNGNNTGDKIVLNTCNNSTGQVWLNAVDGYENPASALCLAVPTKQMGDQLDLASCNKLTTQTEAWQPSTWSKSNNGGASTSCTGSVGQLVACNAAKQWVIWQSGVINHNTLLNNYSDGNGYEEWCADFVSYIYKESGYPFSNGERNGWDEYLANNIQNMGFTYHSATDYTPQAGDVAYFDYSGGHVEIVAVDGTNPIFIYGDSGITDPSTGNGQMTENNLTSKAGEGQLEYYLSPN